MYRPDDTLGDRYGLPDAGVQTAPGDTLDHRRVGRRIVSQDEERSAERAAIEPWLETILHVLRSPARQERSSRGEDRRPVQNPPRTLNSCRRSVRR